MSRDIKGRRWASVSIHECVIRQVWVVDRPEGRSAHPRHTGETPLRQRGSLLPGVLMASRFPTALRSSPPPVACFCYSHTTNETKNNCIRAPGTEENERTHFLLYTPGKCHYRLYTLIFINIDSKELWACLLLKCRSRGAFFLFCQSLTEYVKVHNPQPTSAAITRVCLVSLWGKPATSARPWSANTHLGSCY